MEHAPSNARHRTGLLCFRVGGSISRLTMSVEYLIVCQYRIDIMQVGWIVCAFFSLVATFASFWLIGKHLKWYTNVSRLDEVVMCAHCSP
jgi:hypothetical protein